MKYQINFLLTFLVLFQVLNICEARRSTKRRLLVQDDVSYHNLPSKSLKQQKRLSSSRAINFGNQGRQSVKDVSARAASGLARPAIEEQRVTSKLREAEAIRPGKLGAERQNIHKLRALKHRNQIEHDRFKRGSSGCDCSKRSFDLGTGPITVGEERGVPIEVALKMDMDRNDSRDPFNVHDGKYRLVFTMYVFKEARINRKSFPLFHQIK